VLSATTDVNFIEAPVTLKAYLMCAFAAFGGIFFGFDSGYINGVLATRYAIAKYNHLPYPKEGTPSSDWGSIGFAFTSPDQSLIVSILSAGTFFGALAAGDVADWIGRRTTIILGCVIFTIGVVLQVASSTIPLLVVGRVIAGLGVGFVTAIIILYMGEIAPKKVRGAIVSGYQLCITIVRNPRPFRSLHFNTNNDRRVSSWPDVSHTPLRTGTTLVPTVFPWPFK